MKCFKESDFVVTFTGEAPDSRIIRTWDRVLAYIDFAMGTENDGWTCRSPCCELHDPDNWTTADIVIDDTRHVDEDRRHTFDNSEFGYCVGLSIIRLTMPVPETLECDSFSF